MSDKCNKKEAPKNFDRQKFMALLEDQYVWPSLYKFRFIVPIDKVNIVKDILNTQEIVLRPSKNGNFISVTAEVMINSSEEVIEVYDKTSNIEGLISL